MKTPKITFVCRECGYTSMKWLGKCPDCSSWDSFDEVLERPLADKKIKSPSVSRAEKISDMSMPNYLRTKTGMNELDRVLGGGLVDSSVILISGEPGIGKSTLLLQICSELSKTRSVLYVSGEESKGQLQ